MEIIKLSDNTELTDFLAVAIAEGFCEGENYQNKEDIIKAYSFIGIKGLHQSLQGFFGRNLNSLIQHGYLNKNFEIQS